jgi:MFS family permease
MVVLDFSIVNVALPSIGSELGFRGNSDQWVVTAYAITFGGLLITSAGTFVLMGVLSLVAITYFIRKVQETEGLSLQQIERGDALMHRQLTLGRRDPAASGGSQ